MSDTKDETPKVDTGKTKDSKGRGRPKGSKTAPKAAPTGPITTRSGRKQKVVTPYQA